MFKRLHIYMLGKFVGPLILTFFISVFFLLMQFLWKYIDELVGRGLELSVILELLFYASLTLITMALPLSILLASLMTFGNLGEQYELFAMKSGGISLLRIMYPLVIVTFVISIGAFFFTNNILPYTNLKMRSLLFSISQKRPEINLQPGIFTEAVDGFSIRIEGKDKDQNLSNLLIYDHRGKSGNRNVTIAKSGSIKVTENKSHMIFNLYDGTRYEEMSKPLDKNQGQRSFPHQRISFKQQILYLQLEGLGLDRNNEDLFKSGFEMLNINQLSIASDSLEKRLKYRRIDIAENILLYNLYKGRKNPYPPEKDYGKLNFVPQIIKNIDSISNLQHSIYGILPDEPSIPSLSFDSIYNSLSLNQKSKILDFALNYGRSTNTYVDMTGDEVEISLKWIARHDIEWHRKFTVSIACLVLFFIGAPLGAIIRKGGFGTPVVVSVFIFLMYYIISITFEKTARELAISASLGMWISVAVMLPLGIYLTYKAMNDSLIISNEQYKRLTNLFKIKFKSKKPKKES